jgi:hypothetical protein
MRIRNTAQNSILEPIKSVNFIANESYLLFFLFNNSGGREGGEGVGNPAPVCGGQGPRIRLLIGTQQFISMVLKYSQKFSLPQINIEAGSGCYIQSILQPEAVSVPTNLG